MIILLCISGFVIFLFHHLYWKRRHLPPGPTPLPFLGNVLTLKQYEPGYDAYKKWAQDYGPIYTIWLGPQPMVIVTDFELLKKTFIKDGAKYAGREPNPLMIRMKGGDYGLITTSGDQWSQQRRFALQVLRDFGLGKNLMEERILVEVQHLIEVIRREGSNGPIDLRDHIDAAVGSIINNILFGYRYDETNMEEFLTLKNKLSQLMDIFGSPEIALIASMPFLLRFPYFQKYERLVMGTMHQLRNLFQDQVDEHKKSIDMDSDQCSDFCEAYLKEQKKHEHEPDRGGFSNMQMVNVFHDLWAAGMETTSNTLYWGVLYVLRAPEVLKKIHDELDTVIGPDPQPIVSSDRQILPYMNAVAQEVQRLANLLPFNIPHQLMDDVEIEGYNLPKDTIVVPQISAVLYDEKVFPEPYEFRPERHLDESGNFVKIEEMIPFSIGKRSCPGESMARMEIFLFLANLFHCYDIKPVDKNNLPSIKKNMGASMKAESFRLHLIPRK